MCVYFLLCTSVQCNGFFRYLFYISISTKLLQEIARHLRPKTLRARFGIDKIKNAVHCTDLPDDGPLEV